MLRFGRTIGQTRSLYTMETTAIWVNKDAGAVRLRSAMRRPQIVVLNEKQIIRREENTQQNYFLALANKQSHILANQALYIDLNTSNNELVLRWSKRLALASSPLAAATHAYTDLHGI